MSWDKFESGLSDGPYVGLWTIGKWVAVVIAIVIFWTIVFKPFDYFSKITQVDNAIYNYEYFHKQSQSYIAIKNNIVVAANAVKQFKVDAGPRNTWGFADKTESARLSTIVTGLTYQCNALVADYNAKAETVTRNIFKTNSTPYKLQECK